MAICLSVGLFMGNFLTPQVAIPTSGGEERLQKLQDIIYILNQRYVDSLNGDQLFEETIADMLHSLDPHSNYIPAEELKALNESIEGKFGGVGMRFFIIRDTVCITNVIEGSPAMNAGLRAGDKIIKVDDKKITGIDITNEDLMALLKGREGTEVKVTVKRQDKTFSRKVVRGTIPVRSVSASYMLTNDVGYIKIDQFSVVSHFEFVDAARSLREKGMKKIIIDLRNNGGGVLTSATDIADEFLKAGVPIVETKGEHSPTITYRATSKGELEDVEVAILMNSNSASASEILAGAIQDNDRGIIIGRRSFGKGLVQEDFPLRDGSNLRLTIARYYTPTGRCIQKPYSDDYHAYLEDQMDRYDNGEMYKVDSTWFVDSLKFTTPGGRTVYGGGGIMPDIFVPFDSTGSSWYYTELRYASVFNTFAFDYVQNKRNKWKSVDQFETEFKVTKALIEELAQYANSEFNIRYDEAGMNRSRKLISRVLKAEIARQIWVEGGYYQIYNDTDPDVLKALEELK